MLKPFEDMLKRELAKHPRTQQQQRLLEMMVEIGSLGDDAQQAYIDEVMRRYIARIPSN